MRKNTDHLQRRQHSEVSASQSFGLTFSFERKRPGEGDGRRLNADGEGEEGAPSLLRGCCSEVGAVDEPHGAESGPIRSDDSIPYVHLDGDHVPDFRWQGRNVRVFGFERDRRSCATERQGEKKVGLGLEPRLRGFLPGNPGFRVRWRRFGKERGG
jgi:hypothetical protein